MEQDKELNFIWVQSFLEQDKELNFIWVQSFLEERRHADQLWKMTTGAKGSALAAIVAGWGALKCESERSLRHAIARGQLLFCFDGTTVLQGGAA
mgnify:CR=1 FL=1